MVYFTENEVFRRGFLSNTQKKIIVLDAPSEKNGYNTGLYFVLTAKKVGSLCKTSGSTSSNLPRQNFRSGGPSERLGVLRPFKNVMTYYLYHPNPCPGVIL